MDFLTTTVNQRILFNKLNLPTEIKKVESFKSSVAGSDLSDVKGIGEATKVKLLEAGISTKSELKGLSAEAVKEIITNPLSQKGIIKFINDNTEGL